jgi:YD repeat-containing protein
MPDELITTLTDCTGFGSADTYEGECSFEISYSERPSAASEIKAKGVACGDATAEDTAGLPPPPDLSPWDLPVPADDPASDDDDDEEKCDASVPESGEPVRLTNGNMRFQDHDILPAQYASLTVRTYDSINTTNGLFGRGWHSFFDSRVESNGSGQYRIVKGNNISVYFEESGGSYTQIWPSSRRQGSLTSAGGAFTYMSGNTIRTFDSSTGRLIGYEKRGSSEEITITYDANGHPTSVYGTLANTTTWSWSISCNSAGLVDRISTANATWRYHYTGSLLTEVTVDGATWRTYIYDYSYDGREKLEEVRDGAGYIIERHRYYPESHPRFPGWAMTSESPYEMITSIEYQVESSRLDRALSYEDGEYAARVTWATGLYSDYYIRPVPGGPHRVVEIRGNCTCSGGGDFTAFSYDAVGRKVREQNGRGYITTWSYDGLNRLDSKTKGLSPQGCDPETDINHCRVTPEDPLESLGLDSTEAVTLTYSYDSFWTHKLASVCRQSVLETEQDTCTSYTYDPTTGAMLTESTRGYTWDHDADATALEVRTTTRSYYGSDENAVFDPAAVAGNLGVTIIFISDWAGDEYDQPRGALKEIDGPMPGAEDAVQLVYYPDEPAVPSILRGRLAARKYPENLYTLIDGYDEHGNPTRIIDRAGSAREISYDALGRVSTSVLVGVSGCDTTLDHLCDQDLSTYHAYESVTGPLEQVFSPAGTLIKHGHDAWGRTQAVRRGSMADGLVEGRVIERDPYSGLVVYEELVKLENESWITYYSKSFEHDAYGRLINVVRPDPNWQDGDIEEYTYDSVGNRVTFKDPNHGSPNMLFEYDRLNRMTKFKQLIQD